MNRWGFDSDGVMGGKKDGEWVRHEDVLPYIAVVIVLAEMGNPKYMYYPSWLSRLIYKAKELSKEFVREDKDAR